MAGTSSSAKQWEGADTRSKEAKHTPLNSTERYMIREDMLMLFETRRDALHLIHASRKEKPVVGDSSPSIHVVSSFRKGVSSASNLSIEDTLVELDVEEYRIMVDGRLDSLSRKCSGAVIDIPTSQKCVDVPGENLQDISQSFTRTTLHDDEIHVVAFHKPFAPLTAEEEEEVSVALNGPNSKYDNSWSGTSEHFIDDDAYAGENCWSCMKNPILKLLETSCDVYYLVINLYLELLKEREIRNPKQFLRCHFFNTFFYKKLASGMNGYDFKAVRRWTTYKKIGYGIIECDKVKSVTNFSVIPLGIVNVLSAMIFVPIHKEIHWCLAVISVREKKFQYLDSLRGMDHQVLEVLARYLADEVKDKSGKFMDFSSWEQELVVDLPEQQNGWDCGMFMIKYADFYSQGMSLSFSQVNFPNDVFQF
ncbi:Ubiquitin-like-specific protease [Nymphaea thermarum]|nr:Ubiquitin-like-specific protease [Nymphaea thermarum]